MAIYHLMFLWQFWLIFDLYTYFAIGLPNEGRSTSKCGEDSSDELGLQWASGATYYRRVHRTYCCRSFQLIPGICSGNSCALFDEMWICSLLNSL